MSETVDVKVRRINQTAIQQAGTNDTQLYFDMGCLRVRTDDQISKIYEMMDAIPDKCGGGHMLFNGKLQRDLELTFENLRAGTDSTFMLASAEGGVSGGKAKKWWRFKNPLTGSTWYWSENTDSVCFVPKQDITWYGWGCYSARGDHDLDIECRWMLDDPDNIVQDWTKTTLSHETHDPETKTHDVLLTMFGAKPIKVKAGQKIYLCNKSAMGRTHVNYGD